MPIAVKNAVKAPTPVTVLVDQLGKVKAKIANLEKTEATLRQDIIDTGVEEAEGELFRATVNTTDVDYVGYKAVVEALADKATKEELKAIRRLLKKNTVTKPKTTVSVTSR